MKIARRVTVYISTIVSRFSFNIASLYLNWLFLGRHTCLFTDTWIEVQQSIATDTDDTSPQDDLSPAVPASSAEISSAEEGSGEDVDVEEIEDAGLGNGQSSQGERRIILSACSYWNLQILHNLTEILHALRILQNWSFAHFHKLVWFSWHVFFLCFRQEVVLNHQLQCWRK